MRVLAVTSLAILLLVTQGSAATAADGPRIIDLGDDIVRPDELAPAEIATQAADPLGLVPFVDLLRTNSLGTDVIDVWTCDLGTSVGSIVAQLDTKVVPYYTTHSRGRISVDFVAKGAATGGENACLDAAADGASGGANGAMIVGPWSGGLGGPGDGGTSWPANGRWALVGTVGLATTAAHEFGHMQWWPHSFTTQSSDEYDNAIDLMSGNYGKDGGSYGSYDLPYDTAVINRYAAGWIDPTQVRVLGTSTATFRLEPSTGNGIQMGVIKSGNRYFTLGARTRSTYDPIPTIWQGVEVYEVTPCPSTDLFACWSDSRFGMGFREVVPFGKVPFKYWDPASYGKALAHVISAGKSKTIAGRSVSVATASGGAYTVTVSAGSGLTFTDTAGSSFAADIEWLAASGITKGCNAANDKFCPNDPVTRGQMAAFLHRALPDLPAGTATDFVDDDGSTFETDIEWLSATGRDQGLQRRQHEVLPERPGDPRPDGGLPAPGAARSPGRDRHRLRGRRRLDLRDGYRVAVGHRRDQGLQCREHEVLPERPGHPGPDGGLPAPRARGLSTGGAAPPDRHIDGT